MPFCRFALGDGLAALLSVPVWVWLAYHFGAEIDRVKLWLARSRDALIVVMAVLLVLVLVKIVRSRRAARADAR